jgi:hypothetical protein
MATKLEQLQTFLRNFDTNVVQPATRQSGGDTWKLVQDEVKGFHRILQGYVNTLDPTKIGQAGKINEAGGIRNIVDQVNKSDLARNAAEYKRQHGQGGAKQRSVIGVKDEEKRVALCTLFETRITDARNLVRGWTNLKQ